MEKEKINVSYIEWDALDVFTIHYWFENKDVFDHENYMYYTLEDAFKMLSNKYDILNIEDYGDLIEEKN